MKNKSIWKTVCPLVLFAAVVLSLFLMTSCSVPKGGNGNKEKEGAFDETPATAEEFLFNLDTVMSGLDSFSGKATAQFSYWVGSIEVKVISEEKVTCIGQNTDDVLYVSENTTKTVCDELGINSDMTLLNGYRKGMGYRSYTTVGMKYNNFNETKERAAFVNPESYKNVEDMLILPKLEKMLGDVLNASKKSFTFDLSETVSSGSETVDVHEYDRGNFGTKSGRFFYHIESENGDVRQTVVSDHESRRSHGTIPHHSVDQRMLLQRCHHDRYLPFQRSRAHVPGIGGQYPLRHPPHVQ